MKQRLQYEPLVAAHAAALFAALADDDRVWRYLGPPDSDPPRRESRRVNRLGRSRAVNGLLTAEWVRKAILQAQLTRCAALLGARDPIGHARVPKRRDRCRRVGAATSHDRGQPTIARAQRRERAHERASPKSNRSARTAGNAFTVVYMRADISASPQARNATTPDFIVRSDTAVEFVKSVSIPVT